MNMLVFGDAGRHGKTKGPRIHEGVGPRQQLHIPGSSSIMRLQLMLAGESAIALAARGRRVTEYKEKGAPLDYRLFDPTRRRPQRVGSDASILHLSISSSTGFIREAQVPDGTADPRLTLRKGVKQIPRHQELYKKEFVFVNPASIGANLNELIASYQQVFKRPLDL